MLSCFWPVNFQNRRRKKKTEKKRKQSEQSYWMSVWIRCLPVNMDALHSMLVAIFLLFPFVKSKNIVVLRKVYPKFSLFFCFSIWCFASYALDWDSFCCSCLFVCVSSFVDCCWSSFMNFNHYHYFSNASPVKRNAFGVGSRLSAQVSTDFNLSSVSTQSFYLSCSLSLSHSISFSLKLNEFHQLVDE